ncbi:MAG: hypothetical protein KAJ70_02165 [Candidatus Omnitrophica bacterium]|nr:hypothetical protein [Candidatus Omnitrophota bacterium]
MATAADKDRSGHTPADKMLEFSLLRLKESMQKTTQKNERLSFENDMLRKGIADLQKVKETLSEKKGELSGRSDAYRPRKKVQFTEVADMDGRKRRTRELIAIFQRDIKHFEKKIRVLEDRLSGAGFNSSKKTLLERKKRSGKALIEAEKKLGSLEKRNLRPIKQIKGLEGVQTELTREIERLQDRFNRF